MNTINRSTPKLSTRARSAMIPFAIFAMWATTGAYPSRAQQSAQQTFPSAAEASQSLFQAVHNNNVQAITHILGGPSEFASCGDKAQDKVDRELFVQKYQEMHRLGREADKSVTLYIGAENWPFPIPLVEKNGIWRFDPDAGMKEVLFRRIGENELTAIAVCHEFIAAEKQHRSQLSTANPADSFPASLVASESAGGGNPVLFQGYYFHVSATRPTNGARPATVGKPTGGFALIAYPADYRSSGVMTFIVTANGVVYEKDLGVKTSALASAMRAFHNDATWHVSDE
jgi:hypothetical protein